MSDTREPDGNEPLDATVTDYLIGFNKKDPSFVLFSRTGDGGRTGQGKLSPTYDTYDWFRIVAVPLSDDEWTPVR